MKLLYINDELATGDGSNSHAVGMLHSFQNILGKKNVRSYPQPEDGSQKVINLKSGKLKTRLKSPLQVIRFFRKKVLSIKRSKYIIQNLKNEGFIPTHVIARSTVFDITAIYIAKAFKARLVYEINTPMFYECGVIKKEPLLGAIESWEKKIIEASDNVYVVSSVCRDMLCKQYGFKNQGKFIVIPNGYMSELYTELEEEKKNIRAAIRGVEGLDSEFVITFVGSLKVWHGIKKFCETAALMEKYSSIRFLVLGDGDMHDMIANYTANHTNMIFKGKVSLDVMKKYLYASDLGIMPYEKKDNFYYSPLKMFDMLGAQLPFIGTSVGQIDELTEQYLSNDFLIADNDPAHIIKKIKCIKQKQDILIKMREEIGKCKSQFTWDERCEILIQSIS